MNVDQIRDFCLSFPDATENLQWGDDLCFKVRGKIFVVASLKAVPRQLCFKCTPEIFAQLIEQEDISPAPYVGRYHWVLLERLDALRDGELKEFIERSYAMVSANAPKRQARKSSVKRPVMKKKSSRSSARPKKRD